MKKVKFEVDVQYLEKLHELHIDLLFLPEKMIRKIEKLVANLHDKTEYVLSCKLNTHKKLVFLKIHRVIKFNQNAWLKPYIYMNTDVRKKVKDYFEKDFFKLMNNAVSGKTMENGRKCRDIKLVTTERR